MTHTYNISGMTCGGCQGKVQALLSKVAGIKNIRINLQKGEASIDMDKHIATEDLKAALKDYPKYQLSEASNQHHAVSAVADEVDKSWISTYKPVLLIFAYVTGISLLVEIGHGEFVLMRWMNHFMAGFFLVFSFFKLLNLNGFAVSYAMYDIVAKKWNGWGYVYIFVELALGLAFLTEFNPILTNSITLLVMAVSLIGVVQSLLNKRKIKCACLGDVFNLPMSTITIIEDGLMIVMSGIMLLTIV